MTNEERIKRMPVEELAHFLSVITGGFDYDLNETVDFHDYVNHQICDNQEVCPINHIKCPLNHSIDASCPYASWQRIQYWLNMTVKENN